MGPTYKKIIITISSAVWSGAIAQAFAHIQTKKKQTNKKKQKNRKVQKSSAVKKKSERKLKGCLRSLIQLRFRDKSKNFHLKSVITLKTMKRVFKQ